LVSNLKEVYQRDQYLESMADLAHDPDLFHV
jgi:hypothetical protein